jgi:hypothetical protein
MVLVVLYPVLKNTLLHSDFFQILNKNCNFPTAKGLRAECHPHTKIKDAVAGISHLQQKAFGLLPNRVEKPRVHAFQEPWKMIMSLQDAQAREIGKCSLDLPFLSLERLIR